MMWHCTLDCVFSLFLTFFLFSFCMYLWIYFYFIKIVSLQDGSGETAAAAGKTGREWMAEERGREKWRIGFFIFYFCRTRSDNQSWRSYQCQPVSVVANRSGSIHLCNFNFRGRRRDTRRCFFPSFFSILYMLI